MRVKEGMISLHLMGRIERSYLFDATLAALVSWGGVLDTEINPLAFRQWNEVKDKYQNIRIVDWDGTWPEPPDYKINHRAILEALDFKRSPERLAIIVAELERMEVPYQRQEYATGTNLIVDLGTSQKRIGISSHYDRVTNTGGANDNASAMAVCLEMISRFKRHGDDTMGIRVFLFDEEENGLKGSHAYVAGKGIKDLVGLINMELVGVGDKLACWPVGPDNKSVLLRTLEETAKQQGIFTKRFDRIVTNSADHMAFRKAGMLDAFTITCISDEDMQVAEHYFKAMEFDVEPGTLIEILSQAPIFRHYRQPTDTFDRLSEASMEMAASVVWGTILRTFGKG